MALEFLILYQHYHSLKCWPNYVNMSLQIWYELSISCILPWASLSFLSYQSLQCRIQVHLLWNPLWLNTLCISLKLFVKTSWFLKRKGAILIQFERVLRPVFAAPCRNSPWWVIILMMKICWWQRRDHGWRGFSGKQLNISTLTVTPVNTWKKGLLPYSNRRHAIRSHVFITTQLHANNTTILHAPTGRVTNVKPYIIK